MDTADFQLSGFQSTSEMFPFNPASSDSSWILYVAATLFPTPSLSQYLPFSGWVVAPSLVSSWSPPLIQLEILGFTPRLSQGPSWAPALDARPCFSPPGASSSWPRPTVTHHLGVLSNSHPRLFFFQKTSLFSFTIKTQTSISFTFLFCLLFVCFYLCFFFCCVYSHMSSFSFVRGQNPHGWSLGMW